MECQVRERNLVPPERERARILIVDDDEGTVETYARLLRLEGYDVRTALSPEDGLRDVESNPPDLIIVDFRMPVIDGLEFMRRVRARPDHRDTPIAIVTGDFFPDECILAQLTALGAVIRYKPLWLEELMDLMDVLLGRSR
jgi:Response regulator containing a CheY-like receiver domain and an HD-GYP domain